MKLELIGSALPGVILLAALILLTVILLRREKSKRRVRRMTMPHKVQILNELAEPFGFLYLAEQDIFTSRRDAWQRRMGYRRLFDRAAVTAHMVIDAQPVYFDYDGRTWMIEFWKGQYGINTGSEVGVYHAGGIVLPEDYGTAHFDAAEDFEMPFLRCTLTRRGKVLYELGARHWWMTGFLTGMFSDPSELRLCTTIIFNGNDMAEAFWRGLARSEMGCRGCRICGNSVCVDMISEGASPSVQGFPGRWAQFLNALWVRVFVAVTRPFCCTADRMLFLYDQLPWCFRRTLRFGRRRFYGMR